MNDKENKANIPESCSKCGGKAFYRRPSKGPWRCYYCDPPPVIK